MYKYTWRDKVLWPIGVVMQVALVALVGFGVYLSPLFFAPIAVMLGVFYWIFVKAIIEWYRYGRDFEDDEE